MKSLNRKLNRGRRSAGLTVSALGLLQAAFWAQAASVPYSLDLANQPPHHSKTSQVLVIDASRLATGIDFEDTVPAETAADTGRNFAMGQLFLSGDASLNQGPQANVNSHGTDSLERDTSRPEGEGNSKTRATTGPVGRAEEHRSTGYATAAIETPTRGQAFFAGYTGGSDTPHSGVNTWISQRMPVQFSTTLWLIGTGMIGLALIARRRSPIKHTAKVA